ncbi:MAG: universal stress protein [Bdellovibrio sp.]|nr:universal stress protein [Bdellovibrio sp.]
MKVILCADLTEQSLQGLADFVKTPYFEKATEIHVTHGFETKVYAGEFYAQYYPSEKQFPEIEKAAIELMKNSLDKSLSALNKDNVQYHCLFSPSRKDVVANFANTIQAGLIVVATRSLTGLKGVFSFSFAEYMIRHAPCDVLVLK